MADHRALRRIACLAFAISVAGSSGALRAQEAIGTAEVVRNEVTRGAVGRTSPLNAGDNVVRRETVATGRDSAAKIVFVDQTNLSLGPQARIVLDEVVFAGQPSGGRAVLNLAEGAFHFVSGRLAKENYEIRTGVATIGIRGTMFSVLAQRGRTIVTLEQGEIVACARGAPGRCVVLANAGDTATITATSARRGGPGTRFDFASAYCGSDPALCSQSTFAEQGRSGNFASLCGR